jgi:hypothetical protein
MNCPVCDLLLIVVERDSIEVDYCIQCHGLWFDEGEIELLGEKAGVSIDLAVLEGQAPSASSERYLRCPRCSKKMRKADLYGDGQLLIMDFCPSRHGLWFDRGETGTFVRRAERMQNRATELITRFLGETFEDQQQDNVEGV